MTNGDEPTNNVHELWPRSGGDDASTPTSAFAVSPTLIGGPGVEPAATAAAEPTAEPLVETEPVDAAQQAEPPTPVAVDVNQDDDEVQWADGTSTEVPAKRRGLRKAVAVPIDGEPVEAPEPASLAADDNEGFEAPVQQPSQAAVVELPAVDSEPDAPRPPVAVGSAWSRPSGDDWSAEPRPVRAEPVEAAPKDRGERRARGRYLAPLGLLLVGLVAAVVIVAALTSHGHAPAPKASARTHHKTHAPTSAKSVASPKHEHKSKPKTRKRAVSHSTVTTSTGASTPVVSTPPAASQTPAVTRTPVTSTSKVTTTSTNPPKTSTPSPTTRSSSTNSSSNTAGGLPDLQQTAQLP